MTVVNVREYGNQLAVDMADGSRILCAPTQGGFWLPTQASGSPTPPDPDPPTPGGEWGFPFDPNDYPAGEVTPGRGFVPPVHYGYDFGYGSAQDGATIRFTCPSGVVYASEANNTIGLVGGGNFVVVRVNGTAVYGDVLIQYAHMKYASTWTVNQTISHNDIVGYIGNTGNSFGSHLHWQVNPVADVSNGAAINPGAFIAAQL